MSYLRTTPRPGGRRDRRARTGSRTRVMRQLGVSAALIAFAAGSFTSTAVDALASVRQDAGPTTLEVVAPVGAQDADVEVVTETEEVTLPHGTVTESDPTAKKGSETVVSEGEAGSSLVSYEVTYVDGEEVSRVETVTVIVAEPVDEVVSVGTLVVPTVTSNPTGNRAIGKELAESLYGWTGDQWQCLEALWTRESGWRTNASNSSSGAYGIPQALPGSKMASVGADWQTNPATQIKWGLKYIKSRYSTPCGGWGHFTSVGWY